MPPIRAKDEALAARNRELIAEFNEKGFYHSIELPGGRVIPGLIGIDQLKRRLAAMPLPLDLTGKRALDIGAWDGFFAFELEKRGAEVTAIDNTEIDNFRTVRGLLGSRASYHVMDVYDVTPERLGYFDVVLFLGVLYHLKHPLLGLERVCEVTRDIALVESFVTDESLDSNGGPHIPTMEFYETDELLGQIDNWTGPNIRCLLALCRTAGFARAELIEVKAQRALVACYRHWLPEPADASEPAPKLNAAVHSSNYGFNFDSTKDEYIAIFFKSAATKLTLDTVFPEAGGYGARPVAVAHQGGDGWQANFRLPPGLAPGWHPVRVRTANSPYSEPVQIAVDVPAKTAGLTITELYDSERWTANEAVIGSETWISIWVAGLPDNADRNNVRITVNGVKLKVQDVLPPGKSGARQVNACLARRVAPGEYKMVVSICGVESAPAPIRLK